MSQPWFLIAQIYTEDLTRYRAEYGRRVVPLIQAHGGEVLVGSPDAEPLEGEWAGNWTVVLRFPSRDAALAWYESVEYAPLKQARIELLAQRSNVVLVPGR